MLSSLSSPMNMISPFFHFHHSMVGCWGILSSKAEAHLLPTLMPSTETIYRAWACHDFTNYCRRCSLWLICKVKPNKVFPLPARKSWPISCLDIISWTEQRLRAGRKLNNPRRLQGEHRHKWSWFLHFLWLLVELWVRRLQPFFFFYWGFPKSHCYFGSLRSGWRSWWLEIHAHLLCLCVCVCVCVRERERERKRERERGIIS